MLKSISFTGHRPNNLGGYNPRNPLTTWVKKNLNDVIERAIKGGYLTYYDGLALGTDLYAAEIVLEKKKTNPSISLIGMRPFPSQDAIWRDRSSKETLDLYDRVLAEANEVIDVSPDPYSVDKLFLRDDRLVEVADAIIAVWHGQPSGGTYHTMKVAYEASKPICVIDLRAFNDASIPPTRWIRKGKEELK